MLSYYNVRYVVLYPDYLHGSFQENFRRLSDFFGQPIAKERGMYLFQVNNVPVLESLVFPGHGMFPLQINADGTMLRQASIDGDIRVLNVNEYEKLQLRFQGRSNSLPEKIRVQIFVNDELATTTSIGDWTEVITPPVAIKSGENIIRFRMPDITDWTVGVQMRNISVDLL
jgi:hypothetical protein